MAEEIQHASVVVPNSIMVSTLLNGALGFATVIAFAYAVQDLEAALDSPLGKSNFVFLYVYQQGVGSTGGPLAVGIIIVFMGIWSSTANMASASRMLWTFCRDRAVPGWKIFIKVSAQSTTRFWSAD